MRTRFAAMTAASAALVAAGCAAEPTTGQRADGLSLTGAVSGCAVFPANNYWNADITGLPVHPRSRAWLSHMSSGRDLHPDFGPSYGAGPDYGIPITVVDGAHEKVDVSFYYPEESDHVGYPLGPDTRIEGGRDSAGGTKHAIVVDRDNCRLYETFDTTESEGVWEAGSGATWSLRSNRLRPDTWTSADAAGLPIMPGLLRWSEVRDGTLDHALRFTTNITSRWHLWPARHDAGSTDNRDYPPMGARFRMRRTFSAEGYGAHTRTVIRAFRNRYGLVLADNGSPWYFQGEQHADWPEQLIDELKSIPASAFVAVDTRSLKLYSHSAATRTD